MKLFQIRLIRNTLSVGTTVPCCARRRRRPPRLPPSPLPVSLRPLGGGSRPQRPGEHGRGARAPRGLGAFSGSVGERRRGRWRRSRWALHRGWPSPYSTSCVGAVEMTTCARRPRSRAPGSGDGRHGGRDFHRKRGLGLWARCLGSRFTPSAYTHTSRHVPITRTSIAPLALPSSIFYSQTNKGT